MKKCRLILALIFEVWLRKFLFYFVAILLSFPKWLKTVIVFTLDIVLCFFSTWLAFYLRVGEFVNIDQFIYVALLSVILASAVFFLSGFYQSIYRFSGWHTVKAVAIAILIYTGFYLPAVMFFGFEGVPRTIGILQPILLFGCVSGIRLLLKLVLSTPSLSKKPLRREPRAIIYGAGLAGQQLAGALSSDRSMVIACFVDDDPKLAHRSINGITIYPRDALENLIPTLRATHVLLAMPSIPRLRRLNIINELSKLNVAVRTLPSLTDIAAGSITTNDIKELEVGDLLGRQPVEPDPELFGKTVTGKTVLVTGAGGSIGSELCRQILSVSPKALILVEYSEYSLYRIHSEIKESLTKTERGGAPQIVPVLCSIQDSNSLRQILSKWRPDTIYHAAAFKHVPLVECNIIEAFKNNVFGTLAMAQLAIEFKVANFVLISTDKAVRPTNAMGATKRVAELILQAMDQGFSGEPRFCMVRFGNVLDSSGSVIPKFREQIKRGGPVTVTHPDVVRYFMTIPEAAQLVIQAASLAEGGEVFLLDMGEPIKIVDLARRMISLSGLCERSLENPDGDIDIKFTGLRAGEKMYEELLIGNCAQGTSHPRIMRASEQFLHWDELSTVIERSKTCVEQGDIDGIIKILMLLVDGFERKG